MRRGKKRYVVFTKSRDFTGNINPEIVWRILKPVGIAQSTLEHLSTCLPNLSRLSVRRSFRRCAYTDLKQLLSQLQHLLNLIQCNAELFGHWYGVYSDSQLHIADQSVTPIIPLANSLSMGSPRKSTRTPKSARVR